MSTEQHGEVHHRKRNTAQRFENMIQVAMVVAVAILAIGLIYGVLSTGSSVPSWMR
jgi:cell division protein FtsL